MYSCGLHCVASEKRSPEIIRGQIRLAVQRFKHIPVAKVGVEPP